MPPKSCKKRPAASVGESSTRLRQKTQAQATCQPKRSPRQCMDESSEDNGLQSPTTASPAWSGLVSPATKPTLVTLPEARLLFRLQGHGLVVRDGKLGPMCVRGVAAMVDNSCLSGSVIITAGEDASVRVWDAATGDLNRELRCGSDSPDARLLRFTCSHDAHRVLTTHQNGTARISEIGSGRLLASLSEHDGAAILAGAMYSDHQRLITVNSEGVVQSWSMLAPDRPHGSIACTSSGATAVAIFPGERKIAVGTSSGNVDIWCCQTGKCTTRIHAAPNPDPISVLIIFPDGARVLTASVHGRSVCIWGTQDIHLEGFESQVLAAAVSQCGTRVVTGEEKGFLKLWDSLSGSLLASWSVPAADNGAVYACCFVSEGRVSACGDWGAAVWELPEVVAVPPSQFQPRPDFHMMEPFACQGVQKTDAAPSPPGISSSSMRQDEVATPPRACTPLRVSFGLGPA